MSWFRRRVHPEEDLSAYADGELGERARRAVESHLATCEACSALLSELLSTKSLLSELPRAELRRSLTLGAEFAAERRPAPAPRRSSFTFAPAAALTVLVALLFVDAIDTNGGSSNDGAFDASNSTAGSRAAEQPAASSGLALESAEAGQSGDDSGAAGAASSAQDGEGEQGTPSAALAPQAQDSQAAPDSAAAGSSQTEEAAPGGGATGEGEDEAPESTDTAEPFARESFSDDDAANSSAGGPQDAPPEDTALLSEEDGASDGLSTLRVLQILAAGALVISLAVVFLPRFIGRSER